MLMRAGASRRSTARRYFSMTPRIVRLSFESDTLVPLMYDDPELQASEPRQTLRSTSTRIPFISRLSWVFKRAAREEHFAPLKKPGHPIIAPVRERKSRRRLEFWYSIAMLQPLSPVLS